MAADLNQTPSANRVHIGFFGKRNAGKSSLVNAVTGQALSIVSDVKGTTTDPVNKAMELLPLGPVVIMDTPGIDDSGELGERRVKRAYQTLNKTDIAVLTVDVQAGLSHEDRALLRRILAKEIPCILVWTKGDLIAPAALEEKERIAAAQAGEKAASAQTAGAAMAAGTAAGPAMGTQTGDEELLRGVAQIFVSAMNGYHIFELKELIAAQASHLGEDKHLLSDLLTPEDVVVLVMPIDSSAPKGRLILPQVQLMRDILDAHAACLGVQPEELGSILGAMKKPPFAVVTDSQAFSEVMHIVPEEIPLTSFSVLMARFKGVLEDAAKGAGALKNLQDGDTILISEGCTHHRQCDDLGAVKIPAWIRKYTGKELNFAFTSGIEFPDELDKYAMVLHCGGCMLNEREMIYRMKCARDQGIPFTNYGTMIAHLNGILVRSLSLFPDLARSVE